MNRSSTAVVCCVLFLPTVTVSPRAQAPDAPSTISLEDGTSLTLLAEARRSDFLGSLELYQLAIYGRTSIRDSAWLASPDNPKALRVVITYDDDLHRRAVADWTRELVPRVEPGAAEQLRARFLALQKGTVVSVEYIPSRGTTIRVDRAVVVASAHHDVMLAFLDFWLGQRPVSEDLKRALLDSGR
jgi:Chalcone isomerase-like